MHLLVEADDNRALSRGMQGLAIRMARGLNQLMQRRGRVFADRYHAHVLRTPSEVRRALHYILHNYRHHAAERGQSLSPTYCDPYSSAIQITSNLDQTGPPTHPPQTWLLRSAVAERLTRSAVSERLARSAVSERLARSAVSERLARSAVSERLARSAVSERLARSAVSARLARSAVSEPLLRV
jgi:hypothetical protein